MRCTTKGCFAGSEYFFHTPSPVSKELFYYMDVCGHIYCGEDYLIKRDTYNDYLLMLVARGRLDIVNEGIPYSVNSGQAVLMNCHVPHIYGSIPDTEFWYVHFDGNNCDQMYQYIKKNIGVVCTAADNSYILDPLKLLVSRCKYHTVISEIEISKLLHSILCNMIFLKTDIELQTLGENTTIRNAVNYILEQYAEDLSNDVLAEKFNMSTFYFSRLFKQYTQQSPHDFLISTRLDKAKYMLANTDQSIAAIADAVGYNSDTGFINAFTKRIGISPRKFRVYFNTWED